LSSCIGERILALTQVPILTGKYIFFDPDGNRLEIFCELMDPEAGRKYMREGVNLSDRSYKPEPIFSA
jgi:hypothetical protein